MKRYSIATPRAVFGLAAVAMTALTLFVAVIVPATLAPQRDDSAVMAATEAMPVRAEADAGPLCVQVIGVRERATAYEPGHRVVQKDNGQV
jgi:hypothetical protein